jgi:hypothetical protein
MFPHAAHRSSDAVAGILMMLLLPLAVPVFGHEKRAAGPVHLIIGWGTEPAFSGSRNSIDVDVVDSAGKPVADASEPLSVQVTFGDQSVTLPLLPAGDRPGRYRAWLIPTRAGMYTFHISGKLKGQSIAITSTCSPKTFDCVVDASDMQFPAKDPSTAELADRVSRSVPRAERAIDAATRAWWMAVAAMVLSVCAVAALAVNALKRGSAARV